MAQFRQSGTDRFGPRGHDPQHSTANGSSDQVSIGVRPASHKNHRSRRSARHEKCCRVSIGSIILVLSLVLVVTVLAYNFLSGDNKEINSYHAEADDFLTNVTRTETNKVLHFGQGSVVHGRDSRYWDRDDRRRDEDYNEDAVDHMATTGEATQKGNVIVKERTTYKKASLENSVKGPERKREGLYNEAGRNELKKYEAEYEASLRNPRQPTKENEKKNQVVDAEDLDNWIDTADTDDEYDTGIDSQDGRQLDEYNELVHEEVGRSDTSKSHDEEQRKSLMVLDSETKDQPITKNVKASTDSFEEDSSSRIQRSGNGNSNSRHVSVINHQSRSSRLDSKKKPKRRKFSGSSCEMKFLNSTAQLLEPLESRKFARFTLRYTEVEEKPIGEEQWEPRFAGHQTLQEREESFLARDKKINCGFVKGPKAFPSTGFDLAEDDANYISKCHIAVISCIFGNSDHLRSPTGKTVTRSSRKNVCFVMFIDEGTLEALSLDGQAPDRMGFIGLWKIVVVKNLPYTDMRRVGKIPKLLPHRLFPAARYSIWLDSKLRLQVDPLRILEYFLWRKGFEYAISNHYDRHCVWEEVAQNKRLNKYNHSVIDDQFAHYQADGLRRFNPSDPNKLLPSNVPEGSFIIRAHTPMSNLFSCLWFNEVDRFTPRDQLSFAYTYQKLRRMNPDKPFHLNMFKDCERRAIAKLYHHRSVSSQV